MRHVKHEGHALSVTVSCMRKLIRLQLESKFNTFKFSFPSDSFSNASLLFSWLSANITKHRSETNKRGKLHLSSSALRHHPFLLQSFNFTWPLFLYMWWSEVKRVWKLWKMRIGHFFFLWFLRFLMVCGFIKAGKSKGFTNFSWLVNVVVLAG